MLENMAHTYSEVFAPEYFVLLCAVTLILYEWSTLGTVPRRGLAPRFGVLALGWGVGLAIYKLGPAMFDTTPSWASDFTGSLGLGVGVLAIWLVWHRQEWGHFVSAFSLVLVAVTVPHLIITPFWDISSHVAYAAIPAGYLAFIDRRFAPYLLVPLGMMVSRPLAGAHTWPQSIGGFLLAAIVLLGVWYVRERIGVQETAEETTSRSIERI